MITIEQIRKRFERLVKSSQPTVAASGKSITVKLADSRTVKVSQSGSSSRTRRTLARYR